jgi:hypothetical protein
VIPATGRQRKGCRPRTGRSPSPCRATVTASSSRRSCPSGRGGSGLSTSSSSRVTRGECRPVNPS